MKPLIVAALGLVLLSTGCSSPGWDGRVERWGTLRAVMRDGEKDGRIVIQEAVADSSVGLGALEGLDGEILVVDGVAWVGRSESSRVAVEPANSEDEAALLILAGVDSWMSVRISEDTPADSLNPRDSGTLAAPTVPFVVRGEFADLELHVLAGRCPYAPEDTDGDEPVRRTFSVARGTLVGFFTEEPPGVLTHHGSRVHLHALLDDPEPFVGHVDAATVLAGATMQIPEGRR